MLGRGLAAAAAAAMLDQATKWMVLGFFGEAGCAPHRVAVSPFLDLVLTCNAGVSFGLFNRTGVNSLIFSLFAFSYLLGFVGTLIAVPLAAAVVVLVRHALKLYMQSEVYLGSGPEGRA